MFRIQRRPLVQRFQYERQFLLPGRQVQVSHITVFTRSSVDHIQAATVKEYLEQTWGPGVTTGLLNVVQRATDGPTTQATSQPISVELSRQEIGKIIATTTEDHVCLTVLGSAYSIAEFAEQLGWLCCALQPIDSSLSGGVIQVTPVIKAKAVVASLAAQETTPECGWNVEPHSVLDETTPYRAILRDLTTAVVVDGYPTRCRPESSPGVDVSPQLLTDHFNGWRHTGDQTTFGSLRLAKVTPEAVTWHRLSSPSGDCTCILTASGPSSLDVSKVYEYRHILSTCDTSQAALGGGKDRPREGPRESNMESPSCRPSDDDAAVSSSAVGNLPRTQSAITSLNSDSFSLSEWSVDESTESEAIDASLDAAIDTAAGRLVSMFQEHAAQGWARPTMPQETEPQHDGSHPSSASTSTTNGVNSNTLGADQPGSNRPSRKRRRSNRNDDEEDDEDDDGSQMPPPKSRKPNQQRRLACPYWKHDYSKHRKCFAAKLSKMSYVKQHLDRYHTPKHYCERCLHVFANEAAHRLHRSQPAWSCVNNESKLDAVTYQQARVLHKKSKRDLSEEGQWFDIWDVLFPERPRPASAYIESELSEMESQLHDFMGPRLEAILNEELRSNQTAAEESGFERFATLVAERASTRFATDWLATRGHLSNNATRLTRGPASEGQQESPRSSALDSGVVLTSQPVSSSSSSRATSVRNADAQHFDAHHLLQLAQDEASADSVVQEEVGGAINSSYVEAQVLPDLWIDYPGHFNAWDPLSADPSNSDLCRGFPETSDGYW